MIKAIKLIARLLLPRHFIDEMRLPRIEFLERRQYPSNQLQANIAIVTRAYNRLEYTMRCVDSVARQETNQNYIHIVVDQYSDDGTKQWFEWLGRNPKPFWSRLGYIRLKRNIGDWGGLVLAETILSKKYTKIVQLDNDMELINSRALDPMVQVHGIAGNEHIVMARRIGAGDAGGKTGGNVPLEPMSRTYKLNLPNCQTKIYEVNHPVACFICDRALLRRAIELGCDATCLIFVTLNKKQRNHRVYKLHDIHAIHIQGWDGQQFLQHEKYYKGSVDTGMEYLKVPLKEIQQKPSDLIESTLPPQADPKWLEDHGG
jgi:glycosyltransferase involved in cell wall biosynthesis